MKFQVQIKSVVCLSRTVEAKDMNEALEIAKAMAECNKNGVKPDKGWQYDYCESTEVVGVFK